MATLSCEHTERPAAAADQIHWVYGDAWEWVWDPFWSVTMYFIGMVPLPFDAWCVYTLNKA